MEPAERKNRRKTKVSKLMQFHYWLNFIQRNGQDPDIQKPHIDSQGHSGDSSADIQKPINSQGHSGDSSPSFKNLSEQRTFGQQNRHLVKLVCEAFLNPSKLKVF